MLSRGINQTVMVGDNIEVKVIAVHGLSVLLGFKAPREVTVHREEIYRRIQKQRNSNDRFF